MFVCKNLAHLIEKALTSFKNFLYWEVPTMSMSLAPINILLKSFKTSGSSRLIHCTSSDSEISSSRIKSWK